MKLDIGENIKKMRKEQNITQEQLADKLGVTFQSVSRRENGVCYPDMELLPALARILEVSTDELLGCQEDNMRQQYSELITQLDQAGKDKNAEQIIEIVRQIRRDHIYMIRFSFVRAVRENRIHTLPGVLEQLRGLFDEMLQDSKIPKLIKDMIIKLMSEIEDDEHIESLLEKYGANLELRSERLLYHRYGYREEWDKHERLRQEQLFNDMSFLGEHLWRYRTVDYPTPQYWLWTAKLRIDFLNAFCGIVPEPEHPISGNGKPDLFFIARIWLGIRHASYNSVLFNHDESFKLLEDAISLLEKVMALPNGYELTSTSPALNGMTAKVKNEGQHNADDNKIYKVKRLVLDNYYIVLNPYRILAALTDDNGWQWFNPIRNDPRYQNYIKRVEALVESRDAKKSNSISPQKFPLIST